MKIKLINIIIILSMFTLFVIFLYPKNKSYQIKKIISPCEIILNNNQVFKFEEITCFDDTFSNKNKILSKKINITEKEAFIIGNIGKYWSKNLLGNRKIYLYNDDFQYDKFSYKTKLINTPYGIKNNKFVSIGNSKTLLESIRKNNYKIYDLDTETYLDISPKNTNRKYIVVKHK